MWRGAREPDLEAGERLPVGALGLADHKAHEQCSGRDSQPLDSLGTARRGAQQVHDGEGDARETMHQRVDPQRQFGDL